MDFHDILLQCSFWHNKLQLAPSATFYSHFENMQPLLHLASSKCFLENQGFFVSMHTLTIAHPSLYMVSVLCVLAGNLTGLRTG